MFKEFLQYKITNEYMFLDERYANPAHVGEGKDRGKALLWRNFYVLWRITLSNACKMSKKSIAEIKRYGARAYPT